MVRTQVDELLAPEQRRSLCDAHRPIVFSEHNAVVVDANLLQLGLRVRWFWARNHAYQTTNAMPLQPVDG
jgi:hypothetical protein